MDYLKILNDQIESMVRGTIQALPTLVISILILFVTYCVARLSVKFVGKAVARTHMREALKQLVETLTRLGVWLFGILVAATVAVPGLTPASLFAGLGVGALAVGFAFQDIFQNFLAGVLIMIRDKMRIGDVIECQGISGKVERISLRETHIRQLSNELTIVPNTLLFKNPVKVLTDRTERRVELTVGVSYEADLDTAEAVIRKAITSVDFVLTDHPIDVFATQFGASSIDFTVRFWSDSRPADLALTKSHVVVAIKRELDKAEIEIPYPYVTNVFKDPLPLTRAEPEKEASHA